jgi:4-amino-4-deoxy-L-arabinose transferase-like glycosyltransferase
MQPLLATLTALQVLWLLAIWLAGAATHTEKLPLLLVYSVACAVISGYLPTDTIYKIRQGTERLAHDERRLHTILTVVVVGIGGVYAYLQQGWPDEPGVFAAARVVAERGVSPFFVNYAQTPWLGKQHPPLVLLVYGFVLHLFGVHVFVIRLVSLLLSLGTLLLTYRLGSALYDQRTGLLATGCLLATPFFFRVGATALTDMPVTFCFILAVWLTLRLLSAPSYWLAAATGLCIGAGLLCKYTMVLVYPILLGVCVIQGRLRRLTPYLVLVALVSVGMLGVWFSYAAHLGVLNVQGDTLAHYARYVTTSETGRKRLFGVLLFRLPSGVGIYNLPLLLLGGWQLLQRRSQSDLLIVLWIAAVFLPLILTLPGPRYFLPAFPAVALVMAWGLERVGEAAERVALLMLLYGGGALYLFVDWYRAAGGLCPR